jgi:acetyl-CoA C-acetyltransferase
MKEEYMAEVFIAGAVRTPLGKFLGGLTPFSGPQLGAMVVKETLKRSGVPADQIDEVIMGNVIQAGLGQNPARQASIYGGVTETAGALTVNKVCGSGLKAVALGAQAIMLGDADVVIAGGMESMSNAPYILRQARTGYRLNDGAIVDTMVFDGLWDIYNNFHMGNTAELVAEKYKVSRQEMDEYAYHSHRKAVEAHEKGNFKGEMMIVEIPQKRGEPIRIDRDEGPRPDSSVEGMAKLKPAFKAD